MRKLTFALTVIVLAALSACALTPPKATAPAAHRPIRYGQSGGPEVGSFPNAAALNGSERILADQTGVTVNLTPAQIATFLGVTPGMSVSFTGAITVGHCGEWSATGILEDSGGPCGGGGGGTPGGSSYSIQYNNAGSFAGLLPSSAGTYCFTWASLTAAPTLTNLCPNAFSALTSGTNTSAAMLVGSGASLEPTGSGIIEATILAGSPTSGEFWGYESGTQGWYTPSEGGNVSTSGSPAQYQTPAWASGTTILGIGPGTSGQCYMSNGASSYASFQTCPSGSITLQTNGTSNASQSALNIENGQGITCSNPSSGNVQCATSAPERTVTSSPTVESTDMGGQIIANVSGGGTLTIPAISSSIFANGMTLSVVNYSASMMAVSTTPTVNAGGGCSTTNGIPAGATWQFLSNGTTIDCAQTISSVSSAPGVLPAANGGSGEAGTITGPLYGNGTSPFTAATAAQLLAAINSKTCNAQTGTTYTFALTDANNCVTMSNASENTIIVPTNASVAFAVNTTLAVVQYGTGTTTLAPASGVTLQSAKYGSSGTQTYAFATEYSCIALQQTATNVWFVSECDYNPGAGTVTVTGSPTSGQLALFSGATSIGGATPNSTALAVLEDTTAITVSGCTPSARALAPTTGGTITQPSTACTTVTFTFAVTAPDGWNCSMGDVTQTAAGTYIPKWVQSSQTTTSCTVPIPAAAQNASDVLSLQSSWY